MDWDKQHAYCEKNSIAQRPQSAPWCFGDTPWMLSADFMIAWGARWGPLMRRQPWRFVTSWFVHESFMHMLSNMALFLVVACQARPQPEVLQSSAWRVAYACSAAFIMLCGPVMNIG